MSVTIKDRVSSVIKNYDKALEAFAGIKTKEEIVREEKGNSYLEPEDIKEIHQQLCERYGGDPTIRDTSLFEGLCTQPYQEVFGLQCYSSVFEKAAKFMESFVHHQVFVDGNKRTGFVSMVVYLGMNGYDFKMSQTESYDFVMDVISGKYKNIAEIADIIRANCEKVGDTYLADFRDMEKIFEKENEQPEF